MQSDLLTGVPFLSPREQGLVAAAQCEAKAERVAEFDAEGARKFVLGWLARHGQQSGEQITTALAEHGFRVHDMRAYGPVFSTLARRNLIRCVGYCARARGHGTAGGRVWGLCK